MMATHTDAAGGGRQGMTLASMCRQDLLLAVRNYFPLVLLIALTMSVAATWLIPADLRDEIQEYVYDASGDFGPALTAAGFDEARILDSRQALEERISAAGGLSAGIVLHQDRVEVITAGPVPPASEAVIRKGAGLLHASLTGGMPEAAYERRSLGSTEEPLDTQQLIRVSLVIFEVLILGYLFVAVMVFQEKQDGVIRAYRVTPAGVHRYVLSKNIVWVLLTSGYGLVFLLLTGGWNLEPMRWAMFVLLLVVAAAYMTVLGYLISLFFESISDWFFVGLLLLVANLTPGIALANPGLQAAWMRAVPSYHLIFAVRDLLYGTPDPTDYFILVGVLAGIVLVLYALSYLLTRQLLMKEARS